MLPPTPGEPRCRRTLTRTVDCVIDNLDASLAGHHDHGRRRGSAVHPPTDDRSHGGRGGRSRVDGRLVLERLVRRTPAAAASNAMTLSRSVGGRAVEPGRLLRRARHSPRLAATADPVSAAAAAIRSAAAAASAWRGRARHGRAPLPGWAIEIRPAGYSATALDRADEHHHVRRHHGRAQRRRDASRSSGPTTSPVPATANVVISVPSAIPGRPPLTFETGTSDQSGRRRRWRIPAGVLSRGGERAAHPHVSRRISRARRYSFTIPPRPATTSG